MDRFSKSLSNERACKLSTVSTSTSEATVGSKRKREPEPVLEPAPEPSPEPAEQGFYWEGLPVEVKQQILERVCTGTKVFYHCPNYDLPITVH